jgi:hypothetical protein
MILSLYLYLYSLIKYVIIKIMNCCIIIHEVVRLNIKLEFYNYKKKLKNTNIIWEIGMDFGHLTKFI